MQILLKRRAIPRLPVPDWLTDSTAAAFNATSAALSQARYNAAAAKPTLRQRIRAGDPPESVTGAFNAASDAMALAAAAELAHAKTWMTEWQGMETAAKSFAAKLAGEVDVAREEAQRAFDASGTEAALRDAWLAQASAPEAARLREKQTFLRRVTDDVHPIQVDHRKTAWFNGGGPALIADLEQALGVIAGRDD